MHTESTKTKTIRVVIDWDKVRFGISRAFIWLKWPITLIVAFSLFAWILSLNAERLKGLSISQSTIEIILQFIAIARWPLVVLVILFILRRYLPTIMDRGFEAAFGKAKLKVPAAPGSAAPSEQEKEALKEASEDDKSNTGASSVQPTNATFNEELDPNLEIAFLKIWINIHGTQLEALQLLAVYPSGLSTESFGNILAKHQASAGAYSYKGVLELMSYLVSFSLVSYDDTTHIFKILPAGMLFLRYLAKENLLARHNNL